MWFFTRVVEADADATNRVLRGVVLHNIEGLRHVRATKFIDPRGVLG